MGALALILGACSLSQDPTDLRTLERGSSPNEALACPPGACAAEADLEVPSFALPPAELAALLAKVARAEPRTELVAEDTTLAQKVYVQRSRVLRFPDVVRVQVLATPEGSSAILHSKSAYGYSDFGVNRERLERWLQQLDRAVAGRAEAS